MGVKGVLPYHKTFLTVEQMKQVESTCERDFYNYMMSRPGSNIQTLINDFIRDGIDSCYPHESMRYNIEAARLYHRQASKHIKQDITRYAKSLKQQIDAMNRRR